MAEELSRDECSICVGSLKGIGLVEVAGEIDVANVSLLAKALGEARQSDGNGIILDAHRLMYIDSSGLQTLLSAHQNLVAQGRELVIVGCHGVFYRLMEISRLRNRFKMYTNVEEALTDLGATT